MNKEKQDTEQELERRAITSMNLLDIEESKIKYLI